MRIGINAFPLTRQFSGTSVYLFNLLKHLEINDKKNEYFLYSPAGIRLPFEEGPRWHILTIKDILIKSSTFWLLTKAKKQLLKDGIDLFWGTENILPLDLPGGIKKVITVFDLVWLHHPQLLNIDNFFILPLLAGRSIKKSDFILTISNQVEQDIIREFAISPEKISVTYLGISREFKPLDKAESAEFIAKKYQVSSKYILFLSNIEPKKNITNLLKAFRILKNEYNCGCQLLLAGTKRWNAFNIFRNYKSLKLSSEEAKFLGYVDFQDLPKLYSGADMFILPSLYEGFGLPALEAMAYGTPVVVSDIPVFREILGEAALFADPHSPKDIAGTMRRVLADPALAQGLRQKGLERVELFSWEKAAKELLRVFEECKP